MGLLHPGPGADPGRIVPGNAIQTSGGVILKDVRFAGDNGLTQSGLLYVPSSATAAKPAPAVLASHGYINTREMQSPFAIELARRGFVVLAMDMTGHGYSERRGRGQGRRRPGGAALPAEPAVRRQGQHRPRGPLHGRHAGARPPPRPSRTATRPSSSKARRRRFLGAKAPAQLSSNLAVVFGQYDEFAPLMWGVPKARCRRPRSKLAKAVRRAEPVVVGQDLRRHRRRQRAGAGKPAGDPSVGALQPRGRRRRRRLVPEDPGGRGQSPAAAPTRSGSGRTSAPASASWASSAC